MEKTSSVSFLWSHITNETNRILMKENRMRLVHRGEKESTRSRDLTHQPLKLGTGRAWTKERREEHRKRAKVDTERRKQWQ